ncbi:hypothetical protein GVAV_001253 [Gurleya vavrai]
MPAKINNVPVKAVIDTAANFSMISHEMAIKLNLPISTNLKQTVTLANDTDIQTYGTCLDIPIQINENFYIVTAKVFKNAAQELLLGMNFIGKYQINILTEFSQIAIKEPNGYNVQKNFIQKQGAKPLKAYQQSNIKSLACYAAEKIILKPQETKYIGIKPIVSDGIKLPYNSTIYIKNAKDCKANVMEGICDINSLANKLIISNLSSEPTIIERGQKLAEANAEKKAQSYKPAIFNQNFTQESIIQRYLGPKNYSDKFLKMIKKLLDKKYEKKPILTYHEIILEDNNKKVYTKPYRKSPTQKEIIEENIK